MNDKKKAERAELLSVLSIPKGAMDPREFDRRIREVFSEAAQLDELKEILQVHRRAIDELQAENRSLYAELEKTRPKSWLERLIG